MCVCERAGCAFDQGFMHDLVCVCERERELGVHLMHACVYERERAGCVVEQGFTHDLVCVRAYV